MAKYDRTDLKLTKDGDIAIENGDFALVSKSEFIEQSMYNRVRSIDPEWQDLIEVTITAGLDELKGLPNTLKTASLGADKIGKALTKDGLINPDDLYIEPIPFNQETIAYFVFVNSPYTSNPLGFEVRLNLNSGVEIRGV